MLGILKSSYEKVEPKMQTAEVVVAAKEGLKKEVDSQMYYSQDLIRILLSQLKYYVEENPFLYLLEIRDILDFFKDTFNIEDPSQITNN